MTKRIDFMKTAKADIKHQTGGRHDRRKEEAILVQRVQKQLHAAGIHLSKADVLSQVRKKLK